MDCRNTSCQELQNLMMNLDHDSNDVREEDPEIIRVIEDNLEIISVPDKLSTSHMKYF